MILAIAGALLPILFVVGLGWLAARTGIVPGSAAGHFAAFVATFALPLSLFVAAAQAKPPNLSNVAYVLSLVIGLIGTFGVGIALGRLFFKHDLRASAIQGLPCGFPNMACCGPPVLSAACALLGVCLPALLTSITNEIGSAAGGVALFTLGLMLEGQTFKLDREVLANVAVRNILQPALLLGAALALGLRGSLAQKVFLIGVLPSGTLVPALAHSNKACEGEAPLTAMASTLFSILSISAGIAITKAML